MSKTYNHIKRNAQCYSLAALMGLGGSWSVERLITIEHRLTAIETTLQLLVSNEKNHVHLDTGSDNIAVVFHQVQK